MSDVIGLLERMGQDAHWSQVSPENTQLALSETALDPEVQLAIASGNQKALEILLGLSPLCGMLEPGKEDEQEDQDPEESPPGDDEEMPERSLLTQQGSAN